jgi:hypothetical protein
MRLEQHLAEIGTILPDGSEGSDTVRFDSNADLSIACRRVVLDGLADFALAIEPCRFIF